MDDKDSLNSILNETPPLPAKLEENTHEDDFEFARQGMRRLIENGNLTLEALQAIAQDSGMPLAYENYKELFGRLIDAHAQLLQLNKTKTEIDLKKGTLADPKNGTTINNNLLLSGTTRDFMKIVDQIIAQKGLPVIDGETH